MVVELEGAQSICIPKFFEGGSAEEAYGEGWRCGGGRFIITFLRKEEFKYVAGIKLD